MLLLLNRILANLCPPVDGITHCPMVVVMMDDHFPITSWSRPLRHGIDPFEDEAHPRFHTVDGFQAQEYLE